MTSVLSMRMTIPHAALVQLSDARRRKYDRAAAHLSELVEAVARSGENGSSADCGDHVFSCTGECSDSTAVEMERVAADVAMFANTTVHLSMEHDGDMSRWVGPEAEDKSNDDCVDSIMALFNSLSTWHKREALEKLANRMPVTFNAVAKGIKL